MKRQVTVGLMAVAAGLLPGCTMDNPTYCDHNDPVCGEGLFCNFRILTCTDAGPGDLVADAGASDVKAEADGAPDGRAEDAAAEADGGDGSDGQGPAADGGPAADMLHPRPDSQSSARKQLGEDCGGAGECASGICVHGVCCDVSCGSTCQHCALAGSKGHCSPVPSGQDPLNNCAGSAPACNGSCDGKGACSFPGDETSCGATSCGDAQLTLRRCDGKGACATHQQGCGGFACADGSQCRTTCGAPAHCVDGLVCNDSACGGALKDGESCGTNSAICESGHCVDGVCCGARCGECQACNLTGSVGSCAPITGPAPSGQCVGDAACTSGQCKAGKCEYKVGTLCSEACASDTHVVQRCNAAGRCEVTQSAACTPYRCDTSSKQCRSNCIGHGDCVDASVCDRIEAHKTGAGLCIDPAKIETYGSKTSLTTMQALNASINSVGARGATHVKLIGDSYGRIDKDTSGTVTIIGVNPSATIQPLEGEENKTAVRVTKGGLRLQGLTIMAARRGILCDLGRLHLVESTIKNNNGLGIDAGRCILEIHRNTISGNTGGGLHIVAAYGVISTIANNLIVDNGECSKRVAGVCEKHSGTGGLWVEDFQCHTFRLAQPNDPCLPWGSQRTTVIANNTITRNHGYGLRGLYSQLVLYVGGLTLGQLVHADVVNTIVWGNNEGTDTQYVCLQPAQCNVTNSVFEDKPPPGDGNIQPELSCLDSNYAVKKDSVCEDAGANVDTLIDITGAPRKQGRGVDPGAYEVQ